MEDLDKLFKSKRRIKELLQEYIRFNKQGITEFFEKYKSYSEIFYYYAVVVFFFFLDKCEIKIFFTL